MSSDLVTRLTEAEKSFKRACEQIVQLNRRLDDMAKRYDKASRENHRSFRYSLRLRMAVTEGVRNMYYEYAANKADVITELRCQQDGADSDDGEQAEENNGGGDEGGADTDPDRAEAADGDAESDNPMVDPDSADDDIVDSLQQNDADVESDMQVNDEPSPSYAHSSPDYSPPSPRYAPSIQQNVEGHGGYESDVDSGGDSQQHGAEIDASHSIEPDVDNHSSSLVRRASRRLRQLAPFSSRRLRLRSDSRYIISPSESPSDAS